MSPSKSLLLSQEEVEQLDKEIESRHNNELLAWESKNADEDKTNTSVVAPTDGLYDLTIGDSEEKQSKVTSVRMHTLYPTL